MSQAATQPLEVAESPLTPESWGKLGMWIFLAGDAMGFGGLLAAYAALRFASDTWPAPAEVLGINLTAFMTFVLICSSVTMVKALSAIRHNNRSSMINYLALTVAGGALFLGLQAYEWTHLIHAGMTLTQNPWGTPLFGASFYVLTGFHGMHVLSGVIYLAVILFKSMRGKYSVDDHNPVETVGLYWHFVDLVWILIFTFVYLL